jgi:ribosomal protein L40E
LYLTEVLCTNCQGAGLELDGESQAVCRFCGTANAVAGVLCVQCDFVNTAAAETCEGCRQALWRTCLSCGARNWSGAESCRNCRQPLDVTTRAGTRAGTTTAGRLEAQSREASAYKVIQAAGSQRRMADLEAIEARRQAGLREAQTRCPAASNADQRQPIGNRGGGRSGRRPGLGLFHALRADDSIQ